jgi:predicted lipid-binding transport protein (Tim44 family)
MGSGGFPLDLVLFGMVAAFLVLRLRSVLGRRTGFERPAQPIPRPASPVEGPAPVIEGHAEPAPAAANLPDPSSALGQTLARMQGAGHDFDPARFLKGAEAAFRLTVGAFAAGDRDALRPLLTNDTFQAFEQVIAAREAAGQTQRTEIKGLREASIVAAELRGTAASVTVRFVSDQANLTLGRDGSPVSGTDALTEIVDLWTFERDLTSPDPNWRLAAARSA